MAGAPVKASDGSYNYYFPLIRGDAGVPVTYPLFHHRGLTEAMHFREVAKRELWFEIAHNLEVLDGPVSLNLTEYDYRRIQRIIDIIKAGGQAKEQFAELPPEVQFMAIGAESE